MDDRNPDIWNPENDEIWMQFEAFMSGLRQKSTSKISKQDAKLDHFIYETKLVLEPGPASTVEEHSLRKISLGETMVRDAPTMVRDAPTMVRDTPYTENSFQTR